MYTKGMTVKDIQATWQDLYQSVARQTFRSGLPSCMARCFWGIWIAEHEGASFRDRFSASWTTGEWKDVFVFCVDGLTGFLDAIKGVFPKADIQLCIVHLVRNNLKYVSWKYRKELAWDLKEIYHAGTLEGAETALLRLGEKKACNLHNQRDRVVQWSD